MLDYKNPTCHSNCSTETDAMLFFALQEKMFKHAKQKERFKID